MKTPANQSNVEISIIIPTLKQGMYYDYIIKNIESLGLNNYEIITIEGKLVNEAWNEGVKMAKGEYIMIINDDIIIEPGTIEKMRMLADLHIIACPYASIRDDRERLSKPAKNNIVGFCFMFKREHINKLFPIPHELQLWYGDNWIYNRAGGDMVQGGRIHHFESKTLLSDEHREKCNAIIERDNYAWNSFYKLI